MLDRERRQLQGPDRARPNPFAQDSSGLDQDTTADAAYGAAPVSSTLGKTCLSKAY